MIETNEEYAYCISRGYVPLIDERFPMSHTFRVEKQKEMFGKNGAVGNSKFYLWCIEHKPHICEECGKPLPFINACNVSHILSRGAHPDKAHDPRNVNILCLDCHNRWENGDRRSMRIWDKNERIIESLKNEYRFIEFK